MKKCRKVILILVLLMTLLMSIVSVSADEKTFQHEEQVKKLFFEKYSFISEEYWNGYREYYEVFASDSATPDYVVVRAYATKGETVSIEVIGNYILVNGYTCFPYVTGDFVYVPSDDALYTLKEFYDVNLKGFEDIYADRRIGIQLIGDADQDHRITVKDSTWIQKKLAGYDMETYYGEDTVVYLENRVGDFNRDTAVNIKDATDIQKYLAGIIGDYSVETDKPGENPFTSHISEDADFENDCIIVTPGYGWGHDYTLEDFPEYGFSSIEKIGGTDGKGYAIYVLYLETPGRENVIEAVKALEYRADTDLYFVEPNYIYYIDA